MSLKNVFLQYPANYPTKTSKKNYITGKVNIKQNVFRLNRQIETCKSCSNVITVFFPCFSRVVTKPAEKDSKSQKPLEFVPSAALFRKDTISHQTAEKHQHQTVSLWDYSSSPGHWRHWTLTSSGPAETSEVLQCVTASSRWADD